MDKETYVANVNSYVTDYIKFGDAKAGSVMAFISVIVGAGKLLWRMTNRLKMR